MNCVIVDWDRISELQSEVGEDGIAEVVTLFVQECADALEALTLSSDTGTAAERLHFLKGCAENIGLSELAALCIDEEATLRSGGAASLDPARLRRAFDRARSELLILSG
jgi:HPt (histidine-containing phosphotransfer) domain-containing protein